jgi:hypothetical protein
MPCERCRFYVPHTEHSSAGECRRFPPQVTPGSGTVSAYENRDGDRGITFGVTADFPSVAESYWCGEERPLQRQRKRK